MSAMASALSNIVFIEDFRLWESFMRSTKALLCSCLERNYAATSAWY